MLKCKLCGFECSFRTTLDNHLRTNHQKDNPLEMIRYYDIKEPNILDGSDDDFSIPDPCVIDPIISDGGGDFGGGGASGNF